jgi:uncharacterized protein (TIGR03083 family)
MTVPLDHLWFCDRIAPEIEHFADVVSSADPATPVPTCPDWDLAELIRHIGSIHRWVERMVRDLSPERVPGASLNLRVPEDPAALASWLREGTAPLVTALRASDPNAAMWAWGADKHVRFWSRRMVHETTIHRIDAERALRRPWALDKTIAADGVEEFLDNVPHAAYWAPGVAEITGDGETLALDARDAGVAWSVVLEPAGFRWSRSDPPSSTARIAGTAADLDLFLWNRRGIDDPALTVTGDRAFATWFQEHADL